MRGQKQAADAQLGTTNTEAAKYANNATNLSSQINPIASGMATSPDSINYSGGMDLSGIGGPDQETERAITSSTTGAAMSPFAGAEQAIGRNSAITKNGAGSSGALTDLALKKGIAGEQAANSITNSNLNYKVANAGLKVQTAEDQANFQQQQKQAGLKALEDEYGIDTSASTGLYGLGPGTLTSRAAGGGWSQGFKDVLGGISGAGAKGVSL